VSILFHCAGDDEGLLLARLRELLPEEDFCLWPDRGDPANITRAVVWQPPANFFDGLNNLTHVLSIAAGVDQLLLHPGLSAAIPIIRLQDAGMGEKMAEYVLFGTLHAHRQMPNLGAAQQEQHWAHTTRTQAADSFHVGILGAGALGVIVARRLQLNGYPVSCWSRSAKQIPGIVCHAGNDALAEFLTPLQVIVCLLPLTDLTRGILNRELFAALPRGAFVINPGRGAHLVEEDLLNALHTGHLSGALLDVFNTEPLPPEHAFWTNQRIIVTPHLAAPCPMQQSAEQLVDSLQRLSRNEVPPGQIDRARGY
jgi:glyoxylate/hydroxypyruvate reductase A